MFSGKTFTENLAHEKAFTGSLPVQKLSLTICSWERLFADSLSTGNKDFTDVCPLESMDTNNLPFRKSSLIVDE